MKFDVAEGQGVAISGTFSYAGTKTGTYKVDFLSRKESGPIELVHSLTIDKPGPFSVEAPKSYGAIYVVAFVDEASDGPTATDPAGMTKEPLQIGEAPIADVTVEADLQVAAPVDLRAAAPVDLQVAAAPQAPDTLRRMAGLKARRKAKAAASPDAARARRAKQSGCQTPPIPFSLSCPT